MANLFTDNLIDSYNQDKCPIVNSLQFELRGQIGRLPGGIPRRNNTNIEVVNLERVRRGFRAKPTEAGHEKRGRWQRVQIPHERGTRSRPGMAPASQVL